MWRSSRIPLCCRKSIATDRPMRNAIRPVLLLAVLGLIVAGCGDDTNNQSLSGNWMATTTSSINGGGGASGGTGGGTTGPLSFTFTLTDNSNGNTNGSNGGAGGTGGNVSI